MAKFNTPPTAQQEEQIIDFSAFVRKYKRYWWLFLLSLIDITLKVLLILTVMGIIGIQATSPAQEHETHGAG